VSTVWGRVDGSWSACGFADCVSGRGGADQPSPLCDEGFYGVPAQVLSTTGALRNPVMESAVIK